MNTQARNRRRWAHVYRSAGATGGTATISKASHFPHPRDAGAQFTTSWPVGQLDDYALSFGGGLAPLLVREFVDRYEAFIGGVQLAGQLVRFVEENPRAAVMVGSALLGGVIGTALTRKREGAMLGAGIGMTLAALAVAYSGRKNSVI